MKRIVLSLIVSIGLSAAHAFAQSDLAPEIATARRAYGDKPTQAQLAELLNAVAWAHRAEGWGLSRKAGGNRCESPSLPALGPVACDILQHGPTNTLWDVFRDVDGADGLPAARATWGRADPHNDPVGRPFVAPVQPAGGVTPPPPPNEPPPSVLEAIRSLIEALADAENKFDKQLAAIEKTLGELKARQAPEYEARVLGQTVTVRPKK